MAYTPYNQFPAYQPYNPYMQGYQPYQQFAQAQQPQTVQQSQQQAAPQMMTPPTIHAEIVQVDGEQAAAQYPVGAGASQMMISKDETAIFVKTATPNGYTLDVFQKRPPAPEAAPFNPAEYVRLDALPGLVAAEVQAAMAAAMPTKQARAKKDVETAD